jgi:hypothetical protein
MKIRVVHFGEGRYIIEYKKYIFWHILQTCWSLDPTQTNYLMGSFEQMKKLADTLDEETIKQHVKTEKEKQAKNIAVNAAVLRNLNNQFYEREV